MTRLDTLVPRPREAAATGGTFTLPRRPRVRLPDADEAWRRAVELLPVAPLWTEGEADLAVALDPALPEEGFRLAIAPTDVTVAAAGLDGLRHAVQVLRQLLPDAALRRRLPDDLALDLPCGMIEDAPAFSWRGLLLDPARHFLPRHEVLRQIDAMALHRLNRLQLHLTDEQGWRLESLRFPRLTEVGAARRRTQVTHFLEAPVFDDTPHGGFYTQDDIREIVAYAADRGITVVPEIELPAHCGALLAAYPELGSPHRADREVMGTWGIHDTVLAPIAATVDFFRDLFVEVAGLFPGPWIHVGGDESVPAAWATDPRVQAEAAGRGLAGAPALLADFMARIEGAVAAAGKRMITWDDSFAAIAQAGASDSRAAVMAWRGEPVARRAAEAGRDVILTPIRPTYLDYSEAMTEDEWLSIGGPVTLRDLAEWRPLGPAWTEAERAGVLGVQAQAWSEFIPDPRRLDYMLHPRLAAFAEAAWRGEGAGEADLGPRLTSHLGRLAALGLEFRPLEGPHPWQKAGTGVHRPFLGGETLDEILAVHEGGAERGETPHGVTADQHAGAPS